jgi:anti-sigma B factor antagonist
VPLKITERTADDVTILDLEGRIVLGEESSALRERVKSLLNQGRRNILLNMANVSYIDSAGLGALVASYTSAKNQGATLKLVNLGSKFREVLQVTKLLTVFEVFEDEKTALASFRASA